ncbi:hypothetical protein ACWD1Y_03200 [Streptomyces sp. NPDC002814]
MDDAGGDGGGDGAAVGPDTIAALAVGAFTGGLPAVASPPLTSSTPPRMPADPDPGER